MIKNYFSTFSLLFLQYLSNVIIIFQVVLRWINFVALEVFGENLYIRYRDILFIWFPRKFLRQHSHKIQNGFLTFSLQFVPYLLHYYSFRHDYAIGNVKQPLFIYN